MLLDTKKKKIRFAVIMLAVWGTGGVIYAIKGSLLLSIVAFAVALGMGLKLYGALKQSDK
ncbi:hypothetical protein WJ0W_001635 [Paenibacillus melissococcoides]|uniref:Uncharacterized protein n=1 Tax=Paenibacillus melissococcoides TaxID=2912268 RepID=A0ABM9FYQ6_9BACL|nr:MULTISPECIES: hypothetical protein [Paenibacillus]MEB9893415.1 hypothetical protein [Bacillus cereus]CAH8244398.1 hypothetical protein WJ0W_001635 [Paenibacillus melissococcoides]CAH8703288.1 hypothetical protein HTL2_000036 [Paenibacillus melissococcoides]CAH8705639.1 hypothetical protein WDD9_000996 [Paenibacillus melissococcoides]GIO80801.1 hypothetical protein J6TS7_44110 [Paenibacillus dendritiformis]